MTSLSRILRPLLALALTLALALLPAACANRATGLVTTKELIVQMTVNGAISQNPNVRYMFVMNASAINEGPKLFGPWVYVAPQTGWDLPFYLGSDIPDASTLLSAQTPPVTLEPSMWTDAYILSNVAGTEQVAHYLRTNTATGSLQSIQLAQPPTLTEGVDWQLTSSAGSSQQDTWQLNLPLQVTSDYDLSKSSSVNANFVIQQIPPTAANVSQDGYTGPDGWIIDQWNQAPNVYVTLSLDPNRGIVNQSSPHAGTLVYGTQNIPQGVTADSVMLKTYSTQVKQF